MMKLLFLILSLLLAAHGWAQEAGFKYDDHAKRDPLWSLVNENGVIQDFDNDFAVSDLTLQGIVADPAGNNIAIINGRVVKTHEMIGQYIVGKITKDIVELIKGQERFELKLQKEE